VSDPSDDCTIIITQCAWLMVDTSKAFGTQYGVFACSGAADKHAPNAVLWARQHLLHSSSARHKLQPCS
jgi:hypothetical protein